MVGALVVTHGRLSHELVSAAKKIVGEAVYLRAISIDWDDDVSAAREMIGSALKEADQGQGVVILTDMFGGTPTNLSLSFLKPGKVEIVTGVNLPMLIKYLNLGADADLAQVVAELCDKGRRSIHVASQVLGERVGPGTGD